MENSNAQIIDTRVTDHWGVDWSPMEIVRDFLQNFYDDNRVEDIKIEIKGNNATVSAPKQFDYKELLYMGSDKGEGKIGQYGEGFKAATINAMRNHNCGVHMIINDKRLEFFLENKTIGKREKGVVMCKITEIEPITGSKLILSNCPTEILDEFKFGLNYFYYDGNPLFGEIIAYAHGDDVIVYKSTTKEGYVFYKKLLRAKLDIPVVFVCNRQYKLIDAKIQHDRDRKAFNDEVLNKYLRQVCKPINHRIDDIVNYLQPWWAKGHKVLSALADSVGWHYEMEFPENYYAKDSSQNNHDIDMKLAIDRKTQEFKKKKYIECPHYMSRLGMKTVEDVVEKEREELEKKHQKLYTRKPSKYEKEALDILTDLIRELDFSLAKSFSQVTYTIGDSEEIVGQLKEERSWGEKHVYLAKKYFTFCFSDALSVLIHEWCHIYGSDGSRSFSDALTSIITLIIEKREKLSSYEKRWKVISSEIKDHQKDSEEYSKVFAIIDDLDSKQKSEILKNIPEDELMKILEQENLI